MKSRKPKTYRRPIRGGTFFTDDANDLIKRVRTSNDSEFKEKPIYIYMASNPNIQAHKYRQLKNFLWNYIGDENGNHKFQDSKSGKEIEIPIDKYIISSHSLSSSEDYMDVDSLISDLSTVQLGKRGRD